MWSKAKLISRANERFRVRCGNHALPLLAKQRLPQLYLQLPNLAADVPVGEMKFFCSLGEAVGSCRHFENAQRIEGGTLMGIREFLSRLSHYLSIVSKKLTVYPSES